MIIPKNADVIRIGQFKGFIPKSWNDLPTPMLLQVFSALLAAGYELLKPGEAVPYQRLVVLSVLMRATPQQLLDEIGLGLDGAQEEDERAEIMASLNTLLEQITFCFETVETEDDEPDQVRLHLGLTRNPYPWLKGPNNGRLHGPANGLDNVTIYELASIFTAYDAYMETKDRAQLRTLMAIMYRPEKLNFRSRRFTKTIADPRQKLYKADHLVERRARTWMKVPELVQQLLLFWVSCCRQQIVTSPDLAILFEQASGGKEDPHGWAGTLLHLANDSVVNLDLAAGASWQAALRQLAREKEMTQATERQLQLKR